MTLLKKFIITILFIGTLVGGGLTQAFEASKDAVTCYKSSIKEPLTFYGNPMDTFTLYDGTRWKVSSSGAYEYIPTRYRNVLICPSEDLLVIDKRAISVSRVNQ